MSLTTKLTLGFTFALLLQVVQMLASSHYTDLTQSAVQDVTDSVRAGQIATRAADTAGMLRSTLAGLPESEQLGASLDVVNVYREELSKCREQLEPFVRRHRVGPESLRQIDAALGEVEREFEVLEKTIKAKPVDRDAVSDQCEFLDDPLGILAEGLSRMQVDLRTEISTGLATERALHDLPKRASYIIMAIGALVLGIFTVWYSRQVARPIRAAHARLESEVEKRTQALSRTVEELESEAAERVRLQRELLDASRQAGKAEVATGVLHNVGNSLNSVVVSTQVLQEALTTSRRPLLSKTAELLDDHRSDLAEFLTEDRRGQLVPQMVRELATQLDAEAQSLTSELETLSDHVRHIRTIVSTQQDHATLGGSEERVRLQDLIEEVLGMMSCAVPVILECEETPTALLDRSRTLQILTNLLSNAEAALLEAGSSDGRITIRLEQLDAETFALSVADNGPGISTENLTKVFAHGFTTKAEGHGFGLHHSANAATEMGGALTVASEGHGHGATFTLRLPFERRPDEVRENATAAP